MTGPAASTATEQLRRLLLLIPKLEEEIAHPIEELTAIIGSDATTLLRDLRTLLTRDHPEPAGFIEPFTLVLDGTTVRLERPSHFRRPTGFTRREARALDLALAVLRQEGTPETMVTLDRARALLALAAMSAPEAEEEPHAAHFGAGGPEAAAARDVLQRAIVDRRLVDISYRKALDAVAHPRTIGPLGFVFAQGRWYVVGVQDHDASLRVFRFDRMEAVRPADGTFEPPATFDLRGVLADGYPFIGTIPATLILRYSAGVSRWIHEREGGDVAEDGTLTREYPLGDLEWAVRKVLTYGPDVEVVAPVEVRRLVGERLSALP
jgi:predicted DNA-binding transcriptional regulator YafY